MVNCLFEFVVELLMLVVENLAHEMVAVVVEEQEVVLFEVIMLVQREN